MTKVMNEGEYTDLFVRKLKNLTTPEENDLIGKLIEEDKSLEEEFLELKVVAEGVKLYEYQKEAEEYFGKPQKARKKVFFGSLLAKAAVLILFVGGSFLVYLTFSANYLPGIYADAGVVRSTNGNFKPSPALVSQQEIAFEKFVLGQGYFSTGDFQKAIELFEDALKTNDLRNQVKEALEWHLCVAYLSSDQVAKADYWMKKIEEIEDPKYKIPLLNKWKVKWQILVKSAFP